MYCLLKIRMSQKFSGSCCIFTKHALMHDYSFNLFFCNSFCFIVLYCDSFLICHASFLNSVSLLEKSFIKSNFFKCFSLKMCSRLATGPSNNNRVNIWCCFFIFIFCRWWDVLVSWDLFSFSWHVNNNESRKQVFMSREDAQFHLRTVNSNMAASLWQLHILLPALVKHRFEGASCTEHSSSRSLHPPPPPSSFDYERKPTWHVNELQWLQVFATTSLETCRCNPWARCGLIVCSVLLTRVLFNQTSWYLCLKPPQHRPTWSQHTSALLSLKGGQSCNCLCCCALLFVLAKYLMSQQMDLKETLKSNH